MENVTPNTNSANEVNNPSAKTTCFWCKSEMNSNAVRCPHCGKTRKDIYDLKIKTYTFLVPGVILILFPQFVTHDTDVKTGCLIAGLLVGAIGFYFFIKASKLLGTYWWS